MARQSQGAGKETNLHPPIKQPLSAAPIKQPKKFNFQLLKIMTRDQLTKKIATKSGITTEAVTLVLTLAIEEIRQSVNSGEPVTLRTFGTFYRHNQPAKIGRRLSDNTPLPIPPRYAVRFKSGLVWKSEIRNVK